MKWNALILFVGLGACTVINAPDPNLLLPDDAGTDVGPEPTDEECDNGRDDDLDGWEDCLDIDCATSSLCCAPTPLFAIERWPAQLDSLATRDDEVGSWHLAPNTGPWPAPINSGDVSGFPPTAPQAIVRDLCVPLEGGFRIEATFGAMDGANANDFIRLTLSPVDQSPPGNEIFSDLAIRRDSSGRVSLERGDEILTSIGHPAAEEVSFGLLVEPSTTLVGRFSASFRTQSMSMPGAGDAQGGGWIFAENFITVGCDKGPGAFLAIEGRGSQSAIKSLNLDRVQCAGATMFVTPEIAPTALAQHELSIPAALRFGDSRGASWDIDQNGIELVVAQSEFQSLEQGDVPFSVAQIQSTTWPTQAPWSAPMRSRFGDPFCMGDSCPTFDSPSIRILDASAMAIAFHSSLTLPGGQGEGIHLGIVPRQKPPSDPIPNKAISSSYPGAEHCRQLSAPFFSGRADALFLICEEEFADSVLRIDLNAALLPVGDARTRYQTNSRIVAGSATTSGTVEQFWLLQRNRITNATDLNLLRGGSARSMWVAHPRSPLLSESNILFRCDGCQLADISATTTPNQPQQLNFLFSLNDASDQLRLVPLSLFTELAQ